MVWCDAAVHGAPDAFAEFKAAAERYIEVVESAGEPAPRKARRQARTETLLADLADALSTLYNRALRLPDEWDDAWTFPGETDTFTQADAERQRPVYGALAAAFRGVDFYSTVVAFGTDEGEPYGHLLSDDLGDVYWDLQEGFDLLRAGASDGEAAWRWRWTFWHHWAEHALDALRIVHARIAPERR